jgi:hypothetical protein
VLERLVPQISVSDIDGTTLAQQSKGTLDLNFATGLDDECSLAIQNSVL